MQSSFSLIYRNAFKEFLYIDEPETHRYNRKFALKKSVEVKIHGNKRFIENLALRLGGETDFNFNDKKCHGFKNIIQDAECGLALLQECKSNHHLFVNFSLMQSVGNLQAVKGQNKFDRLDTFIFKLSKYLGSGKCKNNRDSSFIQLENQRHPIAEDMLTTYLENFTDINDYCKKVYFLIDSYFIERIIKEGQEDLVTLEHFKRYANLAKDFWKEKLKTGLYV